MRKPLGVILWSITVVLTCLSLSTIFLGPSEINNQYTVRGKFDAALSRLNTMEGLDSAIEAESKRQQMAWIESADSLLQYRFYHGTCRYGFKENWAAYLLGEFIWDDFRMIVIPQHILQNDVAVCNQINIVFQELLSQHDLRYRSVGFNHHLVTEVFSENKWKLFDADYEPELRNRPSAEELLSDQSKFQEIYMNSPGELFNPNFDSLLSTKRAFHFKEGSKLAWKLSILQYTLVFVSDFGWILFLAAALMNKYN